MASAASPPSLEGPLNFSGIAREAWRYYRLRPLVLIGLFSVTYLLAGLLLSALSRPETAEVGQILVGVTLSLVLPIAGSLVAAVALVVVHDTSVGRASGIRQAAAGLRPFWRELIGAALLASLVTLIVSTVLRVLLVTPFALLAFLLLTALPPLLFGPPIVMHAVVLEGRPLVEAWGRARGLMAGNWRRLIGYWVLLALAVGLAVVFVGSLYVMAFGGNDLLLGALNALTSGALIPYLVMFVLVSFLDLRAQRDRPAG